jgi:hypothetical protein
MDCAAMALCPATLPGSAGQVMPEPPPSPLATSSRDAAWSAERLAKDLTVGNRVECRAVKPTRTAAVLPIPPTTPSSRVGFAVGEHASIIDRSPTLGVPPQSRFIDLFFEENRPRFDAPTLSLEVSEFDR